MEEGNVTRLRTPQRAVTPLPENVMARVLEDTLTFDEAWAELRQYAQQCAALASQASIARQRRELTVASRLTNLRTLLERAVNRTLGALRDYEQIVIATQAAVELVDERFQHAGRTFRVLAPPADGFTLWAAVTFDGRLELLSWPMMWPTSTTIMLLVVELNAPPLPELPTIEQLLEPSRQAIVAARGRSIVQPTSKEVGE